MKVRKEDFGERIVGWMKTKYKKMILKKKVKEEEKYVACEEEEKLWGLGC